MNNEREMLPFEYQKVAIITMARICEAFNILADDYSNRGLISDRDKFRNEFPIEELDVPAFNAIAKIVGKLALAKANESKYIKADADKDIQDLNEAIQKMANDCKAFEEKANEIGLAI